MNRPLVKQLLLHLVLMVLFLACLLGLFFQYVLPHLTQQGQFVTVPDVQGLNWEEAQACLAAHQLRSDRNEDCPYTSEAPPETVLHQQPLAGTQVKKQRKVYLVINAAQPPQVAMPNLLEGSLRNAHVLLKSKGLRLGHIQYVPDLAKGAVLAQKHKGVSIVSDTPVWQGAAIDLVVGAGLGSQWVRVPNLHQMTFVDAELALLDVGLKVGNWVGEDISHRVAKQSPNPQQRVRLGSTVDLWLQTEEEAD